MPRVKRDNWTDAKFERYQNEGRGQGNAEHYQPWIKVQDFAANGYVCRIPGWKTNREHHFFSINQKRLFYVFEWSDSIVDVREQFPLLDLELAMSIANEMGIKYPLDLQTGIPWVLTTDFMLTLNQGANIVENARTFKKTTELEKKGVAEKLELERRYYAEKGIDWGIITEYEIPSLLPENVEWVHSAYILESFLGINVARLTTVLKSRLQESGAGINKITSALDKEMNIEPGTSLYLFRHLVARKEIILDMLETKLYAGASSQVIQKFKF